MAQVHTIARPRGVPAFAFCALSLLTAVAAPQAHAVESYEGLAYAPGTRTLLYRESHWIDGAQRVVLYRCPGGEPFARKRVDSRGSAIAPDFELVDARDGYREGVTSAGGKREVFVQESTGATIRRKLLAARHPVIDAGFDAFVRKSWTQLDAEQGLRAPFVIPSRLGTMDFKIRRVGDTNAGRRIRLSLANWYGVALPHIDVVYSTARTLLHFKGIGNIRDNDGRHRVVEIEFPAARRRQDVARSEADAALAAPLTRRCAS